MKANWSKEIARGGDLLGEGRTREPRCSGKEMRSTAVSRHCYQVKRVPSASVDSVSPQEQGGSYKVSQPLGGDPNRPRRNPYGFIR